MKHKEYSKGWWKSHYDNGAPLNKLYLNPPIDGVEILEPRLMCSNDYDKDMFNKQFRVGDATDKRRFRLQKSFKEYDFNEHLPTCIVRDEKQIPAKLDGFGREVLLSNPKNFFMHNIVKCRDADVEEKLRGRLNSRKYSKDNSDNDLIHSCLKAINKTWISNSESDVTKRLIEMEPYFMDSSRVGKLAKKICKFAAKKGHKKIVTYPGSFYSPSSYTLFEDWIENTWENKPKHGWKVRGDKGAQPPKYFFNETGQCYQTELQHDKDYIARFLRQVLKNWENGYPTEVLTYIHTKINDVKDLMKKRTSFDNAIKEECDLWDDAYLNVNGNTKGLPWDEMIIRPGWIPQDRRKVHQGGEKQTRSIQIGSS